MTPSQEVNILKCVVVTQRNAVTRITICRWDGRRRFPVYKTPSPNVGQFLISSQSFNLGVATISFHLFLSSAALRASPNPTPVHPLMLSSHLFFCLPLLLAIFTLPCRIVFVMPDDLEMWPYHLSFRFFTMVRRSSLSCILDSVANLLVRHMVFVGNVQKSPIASHLKGLNPSLEFCCYRHEGRWIRWASASA